MRRLLCILFVAGCLISLRHVGYKGIFEAADGKFTQEEFNSAPEWGNIPPSIHILVSIKVGSIDTWDSRSSSQRNHSQDDDERQPRREQWQAASAEPPQPVRGPSPGVPPSCAARGATTLRSRRSPWLAGRSTTKSVTPCSQEMLNFNSVRYRTHTVCRRA